MKVCIQAGHKGMTSGQTGASGERDWTSLIVPLISSNLKSKGVEVYETDAFGDRDNKVTSTDWNLFLAVHYDADIYNDRGGFVDFPDPSVDAATKESQRLAKALGDHYFPTTGIPVKNRSNANTKFYYMWSALTAKTPCVIIECGVGNRKPEDYNTLFGQKDKVAKAISDGILKGLGLYDNQSDELALLTAKCQELDKELDEMRESRNKWKSDYKILEDKYTSEMSSKNAHIESLQKTTSEQNMQIASLNSQIDSLNSEKNLIIEDRKQLIEYKNATQPILESCTAKINELEKNLVEANKKFKTKVIKLSWVEFAKIKLERK